MSIFWRRSQFANTYDRPLIMDESLFVFLDKFSQCLVPKRRNILLIFDLVDTNDIKSDMKPIGDDKTAPTQAIILCMRTIVGYYYQPIGCVLHYENTSTEKLAKCIKAYIIDLKLCSFNVIATVSTPNKVLSNVVMWLVNVSN